jgi:transposase
LLVSKLRKDKQHQMRIETLLNHVEPYKGFVYTGAELNRASDELEVTITERRGSRVTCPICKRRCPTYDHLDVRRYDSIPYRHMRVTFLYRPRRADCPSCGPHAECVPWAEGKSPLTKAYAWHLAGWAKRLPWNQVAKIFDVGWHQVCEAVRQAVDWGLKNRDLSGVRAIGVDEIYFGLKNKFLTLVYQICSEKARLLFIAEGHKEEALSGILDVQGEDWCATIEHVCSDMWRAYLKSVSKLLPNAMHILDRFHIEAKLNEAVDKVRRSESAELADKGLTILKNLRYAFLKRPENLTDKQREGLQKLINKRSLKTVRAYHWKESFRPFWQYEQPHAASRYLRRWCRGANRSRLPPIKAFVKTLLRHEDLILNWFRAKKRFSSGVVEAMNRGAGLVSNLARGFRSPEIRRIALFHALGDLPMPPEYTHRFS